MVLFVPIFIRVIIQMKKRGAKIMPFRTCHATVNIRYHTFDWVDADLPMDTWRDRQNIRG